ncbi:lipopolysaccharide-induced tumor necrosis factor-alpha factor homolog isoform X2 [Ambystoma mexicanum]|uniref:lipopolysaccharide-induced tumor necrosis factor-alpha factor homolog isoform X2 n=1 Tax=Ambystoma mexicanum TaxID=8296 RepID=UPI0037E71E8A
MYAPPQNPAYPPNYQAPYPQGPPPPQNPAYPPNYQAPYPQGPPPLQNPAYPPNYQAPQPQAQPPPQGATQTAGQNTQQSGGQGGMQNQIVINMPPNAPNSGQSNQTAAPQHGYRNPGGPAVMIGNMSRDTPMRTTCPACQQAIVTSISHTAGAMAWLLCGMLILFGCVFGCCIIPFCVDSCLDVKHYCPSCNHLIYKHTRM